MTYGMDSSSCFLQDISTSCLFVEVSRMLWQMDVVYHSRNGHSIPLDRVEFRSKDRVTLSQNTDFYSSIGLLNGKTSLFSRLQICVLFSRLIYKNKEKIEN